MLRPLGNKEKVQTATKRLLTKPKQEDDENHRLQSKTFGVHKLTKDISHSRVLLKISMVSR